MIVGGAFTVFLVAYGAQYAFGVFFAALLDEFGWRRAELAGAFSLYTLVYCLAAFPAGRLTDRWGPRPVIAVGALLLGGALASMALVTRLWQPYLIYGLVAALGMGTAYVPSSATVTRWFVRRRGLAVGIAACGQSMAVLVGPLLAQVLVTRLGWRGAYLAFGGTVLVVLSLVAVVMRRDPEAGGQHPDDDPRPPAPLAAPEPSWTLRRAMRTRSFWTLAAAFGAAWVPVFVPIVHMVRHCQDLGLSAMTGASVVAAIGAGALLGRPVMAVLSDRVGRKPVVAAGMAVQALSLAAFGLVASASGLSAAAFVFGWAYGSVSTLFSAMTIDFFGRAQAGSLVGVLFAIAGSATAIGPVAAGLLQDVFGSYRPAFALGAAISVVAVILLLLCQPPREGQSS
ncbi:MAG TPA: MFS transporter [Candidatus Binatia bacterium]|nr:MFS transporter [Candidatus Binatia bacterium]